jgi:hypothetical protein
MSREPATLIATQWQRAQNGAANRSQGLAFFDFAAKVPRFDVTGSIRRSQ